MADARAGAVTGWALRKAALTALATGDRTEYQKLRGLYEHHEAETEFDLIYYAVAACLARRLGPANDRNESGRLVAELRATESAHRPRAGALELEALIRGLRGRTHLIGEIPDNRLEHLLAFVLRGLYESEPQIRDQFDAVLEQARKAVLRKVIGVRE